MKIISNQSIETVVSTVLHRESSNVRDLVSGIIDHVRSRGDQALIEYAKTFDGVDRADVHIMKRDELQAYVEQTSSQLSDLQRIAIEEAIANVTFAATKSMPESWTDTAPSGQIIGEKFSVLQRVACYVPQGSFPLVSTAIHTAAIAQACGVPEIMMITSPSDNDLNTAVAYAAFHSGVTEIVFAGGAQGIAAATYSTESIKRVDFICGPGNQYVAEAKRQVFGDVGIDMVAGPSEVFVVADETADAYAVACDLVAQAEHGSGMETSVLLTTSSDLVQGVARELENIKPKITDNPGFLNVWENSLYLIEVDSLDDAMTIANQCAPEHIEIMTKNAAIDAERIVNAGAVFIGKYSAEPLGDFVAGPSHVLPTNSSARFSSGLSAASFFTRTSIINIDQKSYEKLAPLAFEFGCMEGLTGHAMSSVARINEAQRPDPKNTVNK